MGDREIVAGDPRHRSDGGQMIAGDRPDGDAHRLRFHLADRGQQLARPPHQIARLRHRRAELAVEAQGRVGRIPMQHQAPRAVRPCVDHAGADHAAQAGGHRRGEHQEADRGRERQMQAGLAHRLIGPAAGAVHHHVGLVQRAVGETHARDAIAAHDQIGDPRAADDLGAMTAPRGGQHGMRVDHRIEPAFVRKIRDRRVADAVGIDVRFEFVHLLAVDPLGGVAPGLQLLDILPLRRAVGLGFPFQAAAAMPPRRGAKLVAQRGMRLHAADVQVVIRLRRLPVRIGPGEADAGGAAADACRLQHGDVRAGLCQPIGDRGAHHAGSDHDHLRHAFLLFAKRVVSGRRGDSPPLAAQVGPAS